MARNTYRGSYTPRPVPQAVEDKDDGGGLLGLGFGPNINLGVGTALKELGQGVSMLAGQGYSMLTPAKDGLGAAEFGSMLGKGLTSSVAGTLDTVNPLNQLGKIVGQDDFMSLGAATGAVWGEQFKGQDFFEKAGDRGILPALIEDVGNVALVGGLATAPIKGAQLASRVAGAKGTASRLGALHKARRAQPLVRAMQHPYRVSAQSIRAKYVAPAKVARDAELGLLPALDNATVPDAPELVTAGAGSTLPDAPDVTTPDVPAAPATPTGRLTQSLAKVEDRLQARELRRKTRDETRVAESARRTSARSPAMRLSVVAARDHILDKAGELGQPIDKNVASLMIGEAITHEIDGVRALIDAVLEEGVPESVIKEAGVIRHPIPVELDTPELRSSIAEAVDAWLLEGDETRATLLEARRGDEGLSDPLAQPDAMTPAAAPKDKARLSRARRALDRADNLAKEVLVQRERVATEIVSTKDRVARQAAEIGRIDELLESTVEAFDQNRHYVPKAFKGRANIARVAQDVWRMTNENGGATFDPHENVFRDPFSGTEQGYMVAVLPKTIKEVPAADFTPQHIEQVIDAYQNILEHPDVMVGTWLDEDTGLIHIDLAERVMDIDEALVKAGARQQLAITDMARGTFPTAPLRARPDIAHAFLEKNTGLKKVGKQLRDVAERNGWDIEDAYHQQALFMRQAVTAHDLGQVAHPDDFFRQFDVKAATRPSTADGVLHQLVKRWDATDGAQQDQLLKVVQERLGDMSKALRWYDRSHEGIERLLRGKADITLLDGVTKINPADLTYQLLAATSFSEAPQGNLTHAMRGLAAVAGPAGDKARDRMSKVLAQVSAGKLSLADAYEQLAPGAQVKGERGRIDALENRDRVKEAKLAKEAKRKKTPVGTDPDRVRTANLGSSRKAAMAILSGQTMDKWTPEFMLETFKPAWEIEGFNFNPDKAMAYIEKVHPDMLERANKLVGESGPDAVRNQALREFYGSKLYTKVLSFWDNLAHPDTSQAVTLDMWMARLFGKSGFESQKVWADVAEGVRQMATKLSEQYGTKVLPHQVQAALWVYVNKELSDIKTGHVLARSDEARDLIREGTELTDDLDPMMTWATELSRPYAPDAPQGFTDYEIPVKRGDDVAVETTTNRRTDPEENYKRVEGGTFKVKKREITVKGRRPEWLEVRDVVNEFIRHNDLEGAENALDEFVTKQKSDLAGDLGGDANARDFADFLDPENMTDVSLAAFDEMLAALDEGGTTLAQKFEDDILGEFVPSSDTTKAAIRVFESGNFATLVHENGHFLRRNLPKGEMDVVERVYGVKGGKWAVDAEERFANDFMKYLSRKDAPPGLEGTFARVRTALKDIFDMVMRTIHRGKVDPEVADIFDRWLNPEEKAVSTPESGVIGLELPAPESGTRPQINARNVKYPEVATKGDHYQAGRKGTMSLAEAERLAKKKRLVEQTKARLEKDIVELEEVLESGMTKAEIEQRKLRGAAGRMQEKVKQNLGRPSMDRTPTRWQPLYQAWKDIAEQVGDDGNPAIAGILADAKDVLPQIQALAMERGFNPAHVSQFSPSQVRRFVFGNMQLGLGKKLTEGKAGARSKRTGALQRLGVQEQSLEALLSASIDATIEARTGAVIDYVETGLARKLPQGAEIPDGWVPWSPTRTFLLTGEDVAEATGRRVQTTPVETMVVPKAAADMLRREVSDHDHWSYTAVSKITSPWRAAVLTLSPGWYVRNFAGNLGMATADGVSLSDWKQAWASYRSTDEMGPFADVPFVTSDTLATEAGTLSKASVIPDAPGLAGAKEAISENGRVKGATGYAMSRMQRMNGVVDEFARAAVYHKGRRLNMTKEAAWKHATEALVDYQNLSPWERQAVRSVIPFYSWQKGILKVTMNQALDHPARAAVLQQLGAMQQDYVADLLGVDGEDVPDYYRHIIAENRNIRSWNPFADTSDILSPEGIARSLNPFAEIAVRKGLGAPEFFPESFRMGTFGNAEADVNVPDELKNLATSSPAGRLLGGGGGKVAQMGLGAQDMDKIRSRILRTRQQVKGIPNPETAAQ